MGAETIETAFDIARRFEWQQNQRDRAQRVERVATFARSAIVDGAELAEDWRGSLSDLLDVLERIATRGNHPDDVDHAQGAITLVAGLFADTDSVEAVYLGE